MTADDFRRIVLGLEGAIEGAHMSHPDFRVSGRIFATLHADMQHGMVKLTPEAQRRFLDDAPDAFLPEAGAWGLSGCTRVRLTAVDGELLGEALTVAWRDAIAKRQTKAAKARPRTTKKAPPKAAGRTGRKSSVRKAGGRTARRAPRRAK